MSHRSAKLVTLLILAIGLALTAWSEMPVINNNEIQPGRGEEGICGSISEIPAPECKALVAFYDSTGGPSWVFKRDWLKTETPCNWTGVKCKAGHVTALLMNYNDLKGSLPPELSYLSELQTLTLYFNYLSGPLPPELGNLPQLETLILHNNELSGPIPAELGQLLSLNILDLESNSLSGGIPTELGQLANLETLNLNNNNLSGQIPPELGNLSNLKGLFLAGNQLNGSVPPELGNLAHLWMFNASGNKLRGTLPPLLQDLPGSGYDFFKWNKDQAKVEARPTDEPPPQQPYPYTTPLPPPIATLVDGTYLRDMVTIKNPPVPCRRCPAYKLEGGEWNLSLERGVFRMVHPITGFRSAGSYTVSGDQITFFNDPNCHLVVGTYTWTLKNEALTFRVVDDTCGFGLRAKNLMAFSWKSRNYLSQPDKVKDRCEPPSLEAAVSGHWPAPPGCQ